MRAQKKVIVYRMAPRGMEDNLREVGNGMSRPSIILVWYVGLEEISQKGEHSLCLCYHATIEALNWCSNSANTINIGTKLLPSLLRRERDESPLNTRKGGSSP